MVSSGVKSGLFMGFGAGLVVIGAVMVVYWPPLFMSQLQRMMTLSPTSMSFDIWRETPIPMYLECFMFNISNVDDILAGKNVTLRVEQMGPYVFRETHSKVNLTWNDNSTVTYYNQRYWHFVPEMSNGSLSDNITSINPIIATVAYTLRYEPAFLKLPVDVFLRMFHDNLFLAANVSSWLFDGIQDPVLDIALHFPELPFVIPYDRFGWFYERNGSIDFDGSFTMNTGASDFSQLGNIELWRYSNHTVFRDECGVVKGSTGELWAPELGQPEVYVFASDLCTYMILSKDSNVNIQGIDGVQYSANDSVFDNGHNYPHMGLQFPFSAGNVHGDAAWCDSTVANQLAREARHYDDAEQPAPGPRHAGADVLVPAGGGDHAGVREDGAVRVTVAVLDPLRTLRPYCHRGRVTDGGCFRTNTKVVEISRYDADNIGNEYTRLAMTCS